MGCSCSHLVHLQLLLFLLLSLVPKTASLSTGCGGNGSRSVPTSKLKFPALEKFRDTPVAHFKTLATWERNAGENHATTTLVREVASYFQIEDEHALELVGIGAVYTKSQSQHGNVKKGWKRCFDPMYPVGEGDSVKAYRIPQRFPSCYTEWKQRVLANEEWGVVVDKPTMVPVQPHASNARESLPSAIAEFIGIPHLYIAHRLDVCASGLVVLAPSRHAQSELIESFAGRTLLEKRYLALVSEPVEEGPLTHWVNPKAKGMAQVMHDSSLEDYWKKAQLEVLSCTRMEAGRGLLFGHSGTSYLVDILLHTGRKHQIRAQLAAVGSPILGDSLYTSGGHPCPPTSGIALNAHVLDLGHGRRFTSHRPKWAQDK